MCGHRRRGTVAGLMPAVILTQGEIRELLRHLAADQNMAVFVSSHLLAEVELTCDRVAIIHKGRVLQTGTVQELISNQKTMEFRVGDVPRALSILRAHNVEAAESGGAILASIAFTSLAIPCTQMRRQFAKCSPRTFMELSSASS